MTAAPLPRWMSRLAGTSRTARLALAVACAALIAAIVAAATAGGSPSPRTAPLARSFALQALGHPGSTVTLAQYAGRPVIINFFASWCAPCQRETPLLASFYHQHHGRIAVVGIDANDNTGPAERFVRKAGVTYPVATDPFPARVTTSYNIIALPQTFFLNAQHRIVKRVFGALTIRDLTQGVSQMDGRARAASAAADLAGPLSQPGDRS